MTLLLSVIVIIIIIIADYFIALSLSCLSINQSVFIAPKAAQLDLNH